jgi:23S rRNA (pseudouridine1915-N3)-methyltransferase
MKVQILSVAKIRQQFVLDGEAEYLRRFPRDWKVEIKSLGADSSDGKNEEEVRRIEAKKLLDAVPQRGFLIALDEQGKEFSSRSFAEYLKERGVRGDVPLVFAIGGAYGFDPSVRSAARMVLSLSQLTLPYQLCRLMLVEQLYRAASIISGMPYHKG